MQFFDGHMHLCEADKFLNDCNRNNIAGGVLLMPSKTSTDELIRLKDLCDFLNIKGKEFYFLTGSFEYPTKTILGSIENDVFNFEKCIGVKTALNTKSLIRENNPNYTELKDIVKQVWNAQQKTNKILQVHIHLETDKVVNNIKGNNLNWIDKIVKETGCPYAIFKLTHAQKYGKEIIEYAKKGCYIDFTAMYYENDPRDKILIDLLKSENKVIENISISSDSYGLINKGILGSPNALKNTYIYLQKQGIDSKILEKVFFLNPKKNIK